MAIVTNLVKLPTTNKGTGDVFLLFKRPHATAESHAESSLLTPSLQDLAELDPGQGKGWLGYDRHGLNE